MKIKSYIRRPKNKKIENRQLLKLKKKNILKTHKEH